MVANLGFRFIVPRHIAGRQSISNKYEMNLEEFLESRGLWYRFISKSETSHTEDASKVTGIALSHLTKNLTAVTGEGNLVLIIIPGDKKADLIKVSALLRTKNVSLLSKEKSEEASGYPPGGTPSVGHKNKMTVIIDSSLLTHETIFCGGGSRDKLLELKTSDVIRLNDAQVGDLSK